MSVLIQTVEKNRPVVFMWRLILLEDTDESAATLMEVLKAKLVEDGLWDLTKEKLVALITDGASTMTDKNLDLANVFILLATVMLLKI